MQLLKFDNQIIDIDDNTSIGITFSAYDISSPGERRLSVSNSFTIPKTSNNYLITGHAGNVQGTSKKIYDSFVCDYWIDNFKVIDGGIARITKVGDRIECFLTERPAMWDLMKQTTWSAFQHDFINFLIYKSYPTVSNRYEGSFDNFINLILNGDYLTIPYYQGNLARESEPYEMIDNLYLNVDGAKGGHFAITIKTLFEYIEWKYSVSFGVNDTFDYNIFNDAIAPTMLIPIRELSVNMFEDITTEWFIYHDNINPFRPDKLVEELSGKSLFDAVSQFFKYFNVILDKNPLGGYFCYRFDDIDNAPIKEMSSNFTETPIFYPTIDKFKQINYIKFGSVYDTGDSMINSKLLTCKNKNIEAGGVDNTILTLDLFHSRQMESIQTSDLSRNEAFKTFSFLVPSGIGTTSVSCVIGSVPYIAENINLSLVSHYSLANEYNKIADIIEYPKRYEVKKWLNLIEVYSIQYFRRYLIRELNGYFFINKISGYNPKSQQPTTIELIKL